jgi:oligopeptide/dipeptide ABC transporter ATP-binding protein
MRDKRKLTLMIRPQGLGEDFNAGYGASDSVMSARPNPVLDVRDLSVEFSSYGELVRAVRGVSFTIGEGEVVAIVGESGCGKSTTARSIVGLLPRPAARITGGEIWFGDKELSSLSNKEMTKIRGSQIGFVFQQALSSLNPIMKVGKQLEEGLRFHSGIGRREARRKTIDLLERAGVPDPARQADSYPFQLSGGMRQRAVIAMALISEPKILIADEPSTALDVTTQAQILSTLKDIRREFNMAILLITHDLGVVADLADYAYVMYAGSVVEHGTIDALFDRTTHPYTLGLLEATPDISDVDFGMPKSIAGAPPDPREDFVGCPFEPRCSYSVPQCALEAPVLEQRGTDRNVAACWVK